jgi:hypothetical protein
MCPHQASSAKSAAAPCPHLRTTRSSSVQRCTRIHPARTRTRYLLEPNKPLHASASSKGSLDPRARRTPTVRRSSGIRSRRTCRPRYARLHVESSIGRSRGHAVAVMPAAPVPIALGAPLAPPPPPVPERGAAEVMPVPALPTPDGEEVSSAEHASSEPITKFRTNELVFFCMAIGSMTAPRENLQINAIKCRYPRIHSQSSTRSAGRSSPAAP